jgi:hypothetical protein
VKFVVNGSINVGLSVVGALGLVWTVVWLLVVADSPETLQRIHPDEKAYILANRGQVHATGDKV